MKNYLFTVPFWVQYFGSYRIRLFVSTVISVLYSSHAGAAITDSVNSQKVSQNTIYISSGVTIYGSPKLSNITVVKIQDASIPEKKSAAKKQYVSLVRKAVAQKNAQNLKLKILQEGIDKKSKPNFWSTSTDNDVLWASKLKFASSATVPNSPNKFNKALITIENNFNSINIFTDTQKFYISVPFSEMGKIRDFYLRGPPSQL